MVPAHNRHDHEFKIRLTDEQAKAIEGLAGIAGVPVAVFIRLMVTSRLSQAANDAPLFNDIPKRSNRMEGPGRS